MTKIAVCIPTRGLVFSRTIESLLKNLEGLDYRILFTYGLPIPDSHNTVVKDALDIDGVSHILILEEDMVIPDGVLKEMLKMDKQVICVDYAVNGGYSTICRKKGEILWCGLGCLLVKKEVFDKIKEPWFENNRTLRILDKNKLEYIIEDIPNKYGGHDILFGLKLKEVGIPITQLEGFECEHLKIKDYNSKQGNNGCHLIDNSLKVKYKQNYDI